MAQAARTVTQAPRAAALAVEAPPIMAVRIGATTVALFLFVLVGFGVATGEATDHLHEALTTALFALAGLVLLAGWRWSMAAGVSAMAIAISIPAVGLAFDETSTLGSVMLGVGFIVMPIIAVGMMLFAAGQPAHRPG